MATSTPALEGAAGEDVAEMIATRKSQVKKMILIVLILPFVGAVRAAEQVRIGVHNWSPVRFRGWFCCKMGSVSSDRAVRLGFSARHTKSTLFEPSAAWPSW